jgi:hypothetical protein
VRNWSAKKDDIVCNPLSTAKDMEAECEVDNVSEDKMENGAKWKASSQKKGKARQ